ncbi:MAG: dethiobiotin synthase, partial [Sporomusaceae bacterium]|nr:dethiobiotin synthase [Sporomusaceae bacterium]
SGFNAGYYKAAQSGAELMDGKLTATDALAVCRKAGLKNEANSLVSYIYRTPAAPHLAAQIEGKPIELAKITADFARQAEVFDFITVEGSGGIICPLRLDGEKIMLADVIKALGLDVLIVADAGLGTINATVLTAAFARERGIRVKGIIFNRYDEADFLHQDNAKQVEFLTGVPVVARVTENDTGSSLDLPLLKQLYKEIG